MFAKSRAQHEPMRRAAPTVVRSIAVLPLQSATPATDYLSLSLAEELTSTLSSVPGLRTTPVASTAAFRRERKLRELGALLNVGAVLQGEVHNTNDRLHVTLTLRSLADDTTLWTGQFDGDTTDLREMENDMASEVADVLRKQELPLTQLPAVPTGSSAAHKLVLRAISLAQRPAGSESAIDLLQRATQLDSAYARAWVSLASALLSTLDADRADAIERRARAFAAARRAIALDGSLAESHAVLGRLLASEGKSDQARAEFLAAIRLDPRLASARLWYSQLLLARGQTGEAVREARRAHELDPLAPDVHLNYVLMLQRAGRTADAQHETAELRRIGKYLTPRQ
jgi:TolB-like protein/Flp pilus assembly protein TadD